MKEIWMRADVPDDIEKRKKLLLSGLENGIDTFIVRPEDERFSALGKIRLVVNKEGVLSGGAKGKAVSITTPKEQETALALCKKEEVLVITTGDWSVIPYENLIAASAGKTKIMACVSSAKDAELSQNILEKGTDGIVIDVRTGSGVRDIMKGVKRTSDVDLVPLKVVSVKNIQTGDRICVDCCSNMVPGEGMLIGSQSSCFFLVQSESEDNGYVAARPFRVNAGAVHAYIMLPDGKTKYLSELRAGDDVMLVDRSGTTQVASVGRCKAEFRPMLLVTAAHDGNEYTTILQNAETVKLVTPEGSVSVNNLRKGDEVLAHLTEGGRHFGMAVKEKIKEN